MPPKFKLDILHGNEVFDRIYPDYIQEKSRIFWTPLNVAKRAAELLVDHKKTKVLDVGSGVGKFCLIGATHTEGIFYGIEQRQHLIELCDDLSKTYQVNRATFIHGNITQANFSDYDAFYLYNPFYENLYQADKLDHEIEHVQHHYALYNHYVKSQLKLLPAGTKVVTYHGYHEEIPLSYRAVKREYDNRLVLWVKQSTDKEELLFREKLLKICVDGLKKEGFKHVNTQNIRIDPILRYFSEKYLLSKRGINPMLDSIIEELLENC